MDIIVRFAHAGLIHGDYNEFNILIHRETGKPIVIDFPQMVSTSHENAEWYVKVLRLYLTPTHSSKRYFNRDVECIRTFFRRRFRYESALYPRFKSTLSDGAEKAQGDGFRLDVAVAASGFGRKEARILEEVRFELPLKYCPLTAVLQYMAVVKEENQSEESGGSDEEEVEVDDDEEGEREEQDEHTEQEDLSVAQTSPTPGEVIPASVANPISSPEIPPVGEPRSNNGDSTDDPPPPDVASDSSLLARQLSRSPPQSRPSSPESLVEMTESMSISASQRSGIKEIVSSDLTKQRARQRQKYHSKRGAHRVGRPQGSKAKQDTRVKADTSGFWA